MWLVTSSTSGMRNRVAQHEHEAGQDGGKVVLTKFETKGKSESYERRGEWNTKAQTTTDIPHNCKGSASHEV